LISAVLLGFERRFVMVTLMLICAVAASLAFGVLVAYGVCQAMFRVFRVHQEAVEKTRLVAPVGLVIES
jgi:hypothetical protein